MKALLILTLAAAASAQSTKPRITEFRKHWASARSDGTFFYEATTITDTLEPVTGTVALIRDDKGEQWKIESSLEWERGAAWHQITHLATGEYLRASYPVPPMATMDTPEIMQPTKITLQTRSASRTAMEDEWDDAEKSADLRNDVRVSLTTAFLDGLERMSATLFPHDTNFVQTASFVKLVSHAHECEAKPRSTAAELEPDCKFDKSFGFPCSTAQEERIEKARKKGTLRSTYF